MIHAITGASGQLGRLAAAAALERVDADQLVLITRHPEALADLAARGARVRAGDFDRPEALEAALAGVDRLLLVSTDAVGTRLASQVRAVGAAAAAGVQHVVYTSVPEPVPANPALVVADHAGTEQALREAGPGWTFLRNNLYAEMQAQAVQQAAATGALLTNAGEGRAAYVTRADCADAAAGALVGHGPRTAVHDVTGPDALSSADLAALASQLRGSTVEVVDLDDDAHTRALVEAGLPQGVAELLTSFGRSTREGYLATVTDAVHDLTGHPPTALRQLLAVRV